MTVALDYTLRLRPRITMALVGLTLGGFAFALRNPVVGVALGGMMLVLSLLGPLPYYLWRHRLVVTAEGVIMPAGWAWSRKVVRLRFGEIAYVDGALAAGDTRFTIVDMKEREYSINADLLPAPVDFELVFHTVMEGVREARKTAGGNAVPPP